MGLEQREDNELVVDLIKAAIGEAKVYFHSFNLDYSEASFNSASPRIEISIAGEVEGKLRVTGETAKKVHRVFQMSRTTDALKAAEQRADRLSKKLKQLHALSDPES